MDHCCALAVVVPLLAAAAISAAGPAAPRPAPGPGRGGHRSTAPRSPVMLVVIMVRTAHGEHVYWFAGFRPSRGIAIGIDFEAGPLSAGPGLPGRRPGDRGDDLLLAVLRAGGHLLPRADADLPGGHGRLLPDRRHLRPVRVVRADGRGGLRADRLPARGTRVDPGRAQLRHHQQRRRLPVAVRHRPDLRPHRRAEHGPDRRRHRPSPAGRAGRGGVRAHHHRLADQGRDRARSTSGWPTPTRWPRRRSACCSPA